MFKTLPAVFLLAAAEPRQDGVDGAFHWRRAGAAYALKYQQNLTMLILCGTFYSTSKMNEVFQKQLAAMMPEPRERIQTLERAGLFGNLKSVEYGDRISSIHVPTLITVGDHDECDPSLARYMNDKIVGSKPAIVPQSGHMTFVDQPDLFIRTVESFLMRK